MIYKVEHIFPHHIYRKVEGYNYSSVDQISHEKWIVYDDNKTYEFSYMYTLGTTKFDGSRTNPEVNQQYYLHIKTNGQSSLTINVDSYEANYYLLQHIKENINDSIIFLYNICVECEIPTKFIDVLCKSVRKSISEFTQDKITEFTLDDKIKFIDIDNFKEIYRSVPSSYHILEYLDHTKEKFRMEDISCPLTKACRD